MGKKYSILLILFCFVFVVPAHATQVLSIGTAPAGGAWYGLGGALADVITKNVEGVTAIAEVTGAAIENVKLLGTKNIELGFTINAIAKSGFDGKAPFKQKYINIRTLCKENFYYFGVSCTRCTMERCGAVNIAGIDVSALSNKFFHNIFHPP